MDMLLPLPVAIPLLTAAALVAMDHVAPRRLEDALAILAAAASTGISVVLMLRAQQHEILHWYGGWKPHGGVAIGISFVADPFGAAMAVLACGLVTLALVYSWTYMREAARLFDVLMLVFCAAMAGFALTGDLFNMFVWFELMGVAAYALAGFKVEELGPIQGAINFAISNTFGAYLIVIGIGLLYARTGALNLAQIGDTLAHHRADGVVIVALTLVFVGFMIKAAIVPFHFWLADAHAVAPAPVCVLFSGAMVELGLFAIARLYWTVFSASFGQASAIRWGLITIGIVTALLGALMAFLQRHLKRLLAYSTISHAGIMLVGIGLLGPKGLASVATLVLSHGLLKGGLFLLCGLILLQLREIDELRLHGKGRRLKLTGTLWALAAAGLIGMPYVGGFLPHAQIDESATLAGMGWLKPLIMIAAGVSAAAILRGGARVFLGWGPKEDPWLTPEPPEKPSEREAAAPLMVTVAAIAVVLGLVVSVVPGLQQRSEQGAARFQDRHAYVHDVLGSGPVAGPLRAPFTVEAAGMDSIGYGLGALAIALAATAFGLWRGRLPALARRLGTGALAPPVAALKELHSGIVGDYVLWIVIGSAVLGGAWALALR